MAWDLVIFDCDGVLVDSEVIGNAIMAQSLTEAGYRVSAEQALARFRGRALGEILREVETSLGHSLPEEFAPRFRARQLQAFEDALQPVTGVDALLTALPYRACVASNGPHSKMETTLRVTGLARHFQGRVFSSEDVQRPKPHPDLFLHAARELGAKPARTLVIEDSPLGIEAARRAGMVALGFAGAVATSASTLNEAGATTVFTDMAHALELIDRVWRARSTRD